MWYSTSSGRIELKITKAQAHAGSHQGQCDADVKYLSEVPAIARQLAKIPVELLASELKEYGAWNQEELNDRKANEQRILWIAGGNIIDNL